MNRYPNQPQAPTQAEPPFMVESRVPVGPSRVETHVFVPFLLAVISMILVAANILLWQWNPLAGAVGAVGLLVWVWRVLLGIGCFGSWRRSPGVTWTATARKAAPIIRLSSPTEARRGPKSIAPLSKPGASRAPRNWYALPPPAQRQARAKLRRASSLHRNVPPTSNGGMRFLSLVWPPGRIPPCPTALGR